MKQNALSTVPCTEAHIDDLIANLRPADRQELKAAREARLPGCENVTPATVREDMLKALADPMEQYRPRAVVEIETGRVVLIWARADTGYIWALGTTAVEEHGREIGRRTRYVVSLIHKRFGPMWTVAYTGNATHQRWLRHGGFEMHEHPMVPKPFILMRKE